MRPSARALATDVDPHALLSQCFLAAVLSKLGNPVGKYVLGSILNAALSEDCKDLPMQGLSTRSFNAKTTMFTCAPELEPISAHAYASRDPCFAWPAGTPFSHRRRRRRPSLWAARSAVACPGCPWDRGLARWMRASPPMVVHPGSTQLSGFEVRFLVSGPRQGLRPSCCGDSASR